MLQQTKGKLWLRVPRCHNAHVHWVCTLFLRVPRVPRGCYIAPVLKNAIIRLSANSIEYQMVSAKLSAIYPSIIRHFYLLWTLSPTILAFVLYRLSLCLRPLSLKRNGHLGRVRRARTFVRARRTVGLLTVKFTFPTLVARCSCKSSCSYMADNWRIIGG